MPQEDNAVSDTSAPPAPEADQRIDVKRPSDQELVEQHQQALKDHLQAVLKDPKQAGFGDEREAQAYVQFMDPDAALPTAAERDELTRAFNVWDRIDRIDAEAAARRVRRPGESNLEMSDRNVNLKRLDDERADLLLELEAADLSKDQGHPARSTQPADSDAPPAVRGHKVRRRSDPLRGVLDLASTNAMNPGDWISAWGSLVALAKTKKPPLPLLGYTDGEGVKWQEFDAEDAPVHHLTREAFRKRWERARSTGDTQH